ncbi:MAG: zinc metallopeptidase [Polyangiaceae bacterium]|nr:zinc metallopeptidase [Polyangiaceae bacterium]
MTAKPDGKRKAKQRTAVADEDASDSPTEPAKTRAKRASKKSENVADEVGTRCATKKAAKSTTAASGETDSKAGSSTAKTASKTASKTPSKTRRKRDAASGELAVRKPADVALPKLPRVGSGICSVNQTNKAAGSPAVDDDDSMWPLVGAIVGAGLGVGVGQGMAMMGERDFRSNADRESSIQGGHELYKRVRDSSPVPVVPGDCDGFVRTPSGARVITMARGASPAPGVLAHEIGHAKIDETGIGRFVQDALGMPANPEDRVGSAMGAGAFGLVAGALIENPYTSAAVSAAVPLLAHAPTLATELGASLHGIESLQEHGASVEAIDAAKATLVAAGMTYGGRAIVDTSMGLVGNFSGRAIRQKIQGEGKPRRARKAPGKSGKS